MYAENSKGEHIIIEIQNTRELDYLMRMLFATSKAITEYLPVGAKYGEIKKVIAVSIVYFDLGKGEDYVYVGQTKFKGLHNKTELQLTTAQKRLLGKPTIHQAYPEYYLIRTTKFNDIVNDTLDEWIYFFKNSEVLDEFRAKGMNEVREKLNVMNLPDIETSKVLRKPLNVQTGKEDGHQGGRRYTPSERGYQIIRRWVLDQPRVAQSLGTQVSSR